MKPVNQRVISSTNGDCFDACMVSILEMDAYPEWDRKTSQYLLWNELLTERNMHLVYYPVGSFPPPVGYSALSVKSALFENGRHAVVYKGDGWMGEIVHNPNPQDPRGVDIPNEDWIGFWVIGLIDPAGAGTAVE